MITLKMTRKEAIERIVDYMPIADNNILKNALDILLKDAMFECEIIQSKSESEKTL